MRPVWGAGVGSIVVFNILYSSLYLIIIISVPLHFNWQAETKPFKSVCGDGRLQAAPMVRYDKL